jgi:transposase
MDGLAQSNSKPEAATSKRRKWSAEDRQRIVQASLKAGMTVDAVARIYGVNASQIYDWRKQHRQRMQESKSSALLPVQVIERAQIAVPSAEQESRLVIEGRGARVSVSGHIEGAVIRTVLECLAR